MMDLDFGKLGKKKASGQTDPKKLFITLKRDPRFVQPTAEQGDVLDQWFARRNSKDSTIKMNTGAGKTLVGLLALQSSMNEGLTPAVYLTPDLYLAQQVRDEARALGIATTDSDEDVSFIRGESILVTTVHKLFNGRSRFGVHDVKQTVGVVLIDDAHACLNTIDDQFRITLDNESDEYRSIWDILSDRLKHYNDPLHYSIQYADPNALLEVPFWIWQERVDEIAKILSRGTDKELGFSWPLISRVLPQCQCVFSGKLMEIAPRCTPIDAIPSFDGATRRIYMTATLANDGILVSHFGAASENVEQPIQPTTSDMGTRMILVPQELDREFNDDRMLDLVGEVSKTKNVVVIVPSLHRAGFWKGIAHQILQAKNIHDGVMKLRSAHVGLTILVNKYDGVDLPYTACELLVIDGMPRSHSAIERLRNVQLNGTKASIVESIQKIEQGMGRGVRSSSDRCVVMMYGPDLVRLVNAPETSKNFTPITKAQLELSRPLAEQIVDASNKNLLSVMNHSFDASDGWTSASKEAIADIEVRKPDKIEDRVSLERIAFDQARIGNYREASATIQKAVDSVDDRKMKGFYKQQRAEYTNFFDKVESQTILSSAISDNSNLLKPLDGVKYKRVIAHANQARASRDFIARFESSVDLLTWIDTVIDGLSWDPEATEKFESAIQNVGKLLGFVSQRPEQKTGNGPDNFWVIGTDEPAAVIECKSGASGEEIWKKDVNQLLGSSEWYNLHYPDQHHVPVLIHKSKKVAADASPSNSMRIMDDERLRKLKNSLVDFGKAAWGQLGPINETDLAKQLSQLQLNGASLLEAYTTAPKK